MWLFLIYVLCFCSLTYYVSHSNSFNFWKLKLIYYFDYLKGFKVYIWRDIEQQPLFQMNFNSNPDILAKRNFFKIPYESNLNEAKIQILRMESWSLNCLDLQIFC